MASEEHGLGLVAASRWRRALAGLIDMAVAGALLAALSRRSPPVGPRRLAASRQGAIALARTVLEEQLGSPGGWVAGIRTVDRRTGARVALWRTLLLAGAGLAAQTLARRLTPAGGEPMSDLERRTSEQEIEQIKRRFADRPEARDAALTEHYLAHRRPLAQALAGPLAGGLASFVINRRLRRRLAPTLLVSRRG